MKINEITETIQGEAPNTGQPCILVRFAGCDIKCPYCDTEHESFYEWDLDKVQNVINESKLTSVLLTGGEPFIQPDIVRLLRNIKKDKRIVIETNGHAEIPSEDIFAFGNCTVVMDVKLFEGLRYFNPLNLTKLMTGDVIKFVFWDAASFNLAVEFVHGNQAIMPWGIEWVFSPTSEMIKKGEVKGYVNEIVELQKKYPKQKMVFQTQLHKVLGVK